LPTSDQLHIERALQECFRLQKFASGTGSRPEPNWRQREFSLGQVDGFLEGLLGSAAEPAGNAPSPKS